VFNPQKLFAVSGNILRNDLLHIFLFIFEHNLKNDLVADAGGRPPSVYDKFEVRRPCRSEDMAHDVCQH